jgi:ATP-dependent Clp protease protease subunit
MKRNETGVSLPELVNAMKETSDPVMYQYYKNLDKNTLLINEAIDLNSTELYVMPLLEWDNDPEVEEIKIYLNCLGGDVFSGMLVAETIEKLKTKTTVEILTYAYSMGGFIGVAGNSNPNVTVQCHEHSTFLIHAGSTSMRGDSSTVDDTLEFYRKFNERTKAFMLKNTNITSEKFDEMKRTEWYLDSEDMIKYGVVNKII